MRKIRNLIGMPVLYKRQKLGRLVQAELSEDLKRLEGIWVDCGLKGNRYIAAEHLGMIGEVAVMVDDRGKRRRCRGNSLLYRATGTDGSRLGAAVGAEIDELSFLVSALEVTHGLWDDLYEGRTRAESYTVHPEKTEVVIGDSAEEAEREEFL
ncbi:MAG: hypothetical protein IJ466_10965 [Clostridia bacterium]|nr:hypothetical protein [Clostridia bacterium]